MGQPDNFNRLQYTTAPPPLRKRTILKIMPLFIVGCAVEMVVLLVLADYTSWQFALLEILASGVLGLTVIRYVTSQFGRRIVSRLRAKEFPGDTLAHGALLFIAGALLILPGIIGDTVGLLLLLPPIRWLVVAHLRRRYIAKADAFRAQFVHTSQAGALPDDQITLDCDYAENDARESDD